jgi:hypothetical protein
MDGKDGWAKEDSGKHTPIYDPHIRSVGEYNLKLYQTRSNGRYSYSRIVMILKDRRCLLRRGQIQGRWLSARLMFCDVEIWPARQHVIAQLLSSAAQGNEKVSPALSHVQLLPTHVFVICVDIAKYSRLNNIESIVEDMVH